MMSDNKKMWQLILRDIVFFNKENWGNLHQLGQKETDKEIMDAGGATLRLMNKKKGHKNACMHHEKNGEPHLNLVGSLERRYVHLIKNRAKLDYLMSAFSDIKNDNM